jgi:hypothetical protein
MPWLTAQDKKEAKYFLRGWQIEKNAIPGEIQDSPFDP